MAKWKKLLLPAYWILCFVGTHLPPSQIPSTSIPNIDKVYHTLSFLGLAVLLCHALIGRFPTSQKLAKAVLGIIVGYAVLDELTQIPVGRTADVLDVLADLSGASVGVLLYLWRKRIRYSR